MSNLEANQFYQQHIAPMPEHDQLLLASIILAGVAKVGTESKSEDPSLLLVRQKAALKKVCGVVPDLGPDLSVKHDEVLYGA